MSNRKHGRIVLRFEPLDLRPRLYRDEEFSQESILQDPSCHNTYNVLPQKLLEPQVSHLLPQE